MRRRQTKIIEEGRRIGHFCRLNVNYTPHIHGYSLTPTCPITLELLPIWHIESHILIIKGGFFEEFLGNSFLNFIQHCFICRPLRFHCVGGCWDRTRDYCDLGSGSQRRSNHSGTSHPYLARSHPKSAGPHSQSDRSHPNFASSHPHSAETHPHSAETLTRLGYLIQIGLDIIHIL